MAAVTQLLTVKQAAERLACHPSFIYRLIDSGQLPSFKFGFAKGIRVEAAALERYINAHRVR